MELANALLALGGDRQNTVPKYSVTPAEIAVLISIHGADSVYDVFPLEDSVDRTVREEMDRLVRLYPAKDEDNRLIVTKVYSGQSPVMHMSIEDLGLPEEAFKTLERVSAKPKAKKAPAKATRKAPSKTDTAKPPKVAELADAGAPDSSADALFD